MTSAVPIARFGGIEIRAHWSWVLVLALIMVSLLFDYSEAYPGQSFALVFGGALGTSLLIFLSVVAHELAHVVLARRAKLGGNVVTVHLLGGTFVLELQPRSPGQEFRVAIAGPIVSFALSVVFGFVATIPSDGNANRLFWPAVILSAFNLLVAIVNLVPGYPMDGARIVRSIVWRIRGQEVAATAAAGRAGRYTGYALIVAGFALFIYGDSPTALMAIIGGWVLAGAGASVERREALRGVMTGLLVRDAIETDLPRVPAQLTLDTFASDYLMERGRAVLVVRGAEVLGIIGASQAARVGSRNWGKQHARDVMTPIEKLPVVQPTDELWTTLELLERQRIDAVVVASDGVVEAAGAAERPEGPERTDASESDGAAAGAGEVQGEGAGDDEGEQGGPVLLTARSAARAVTARAQQRLVAPWLGSARFPGRRGPGGGAFDAGASGNGAAGSGVRNGGTPGGGMPDGRASEGGAERSAGDDAGGPPPDRFDSRQDVEGVATSRNDGPPGDASAPGSREDGQTAHGGGAPHGEPPDDGGPQPGPPPG